MPNRSYNTSSIPTFNSSLSSAVVRDEFAAISVGCGELETELDAKAPLISPALITPNIGTPSSGTLTNCTGYPAASTSVAGLAPIATAPTSTFINVVGIANGETAYTDKALFDATVPSTQASADAAAAGTAVVAARRDHKHAMPVLLALGATSSTALKGDSIASSISDGDTTHAPTGNAVFDALAGKAANNADTTGSAGSLKSVATTGKITITGPATGQTRAITVPDADASLAILGANTFTDVQKVPANGVQILGSSTGRSILASAISDSGDHTITFPAVTGTVALLSDLASSTITGETTIYVSQSKTYIISNYDSFSTYSVAVDAGSVTRTGDSISFTAPSSAQTITMTLTTNGTDREIAMTILAASVAAPTITAPADEATNQLDTVAVTSSAFSWLGASDTHEMTDWELATDAAFATVVQSSYDDTSNKTAWSVTGLSVSTTYYLRCRHKGTSNGWSAWSTGISFGTASDFNVYITTPTATPNLLDAFEGGFYMGLLWNELIQSATSQNIATVTGNITFTVSAGAAYAYAGQTLEARSRANPANKIIGTVAGANLTTLTLTVTSVGGTGTCTDWSIMSKYRQIFAPKASGESSSKTYKVDNTAAPTACQTLTEGLKATLAMVAAGDATTYPAAWFCYSLNIGGKTDWHLPARDSLELAWRNAKPGADNNYATADRPDSAINYTLLGSLDDIDQAHGHNQNSSPHGNAYTASVPAQVASGKNFRTGESEAFAYGSYNYWSASEYSASLAWIQNWNSSSPGNQGYSTKANSFYVRAVRRSII